MKASNELIKLPQLSATMREMSAEMMKVSPRNPRKRPLLLAERALLVYPRRVPEAGADAHPLCSPESFRK